MKQRTFEFIVILFIFSPFVFTSQVQAAAPAGRFTVSVDTVQDQVSGLIWQRASVDNITSLANARAYCKNLKAGGYTSGWRAPSMNEILTIIDWRSFKPAIDVSIFPNTPSTGFWVDAVITEPPKWELSLVINFFDGSAYGAYTASGTPPLENPRAPTVRNVRCVR